MLLVSCSDSRHITPVPQQQQLTNQFAFIREAAATGAIARMGEVRGVPRLRPSRPTHKALGLRPWDATIDSGTDSVVLMNNDGTGEMVVSAQGGWFHSIQLNFYGDKAVFTADVTVNGVTNEQVLLATKSGTSTYTTTQLTTDAEDHFTPQLSLDGTKVIFTKHNMAIEHDQAYVMSVNGGAETVVPTPDTTEVVTPVFTADGKGMIFEDCSIDSINMVQLDGTGMKVLDNADGSVLDDQPFLSADGKLITYLHDGDVYTMDLNGQNQKQLTTDQMSADPMFVNQKIVFLSFRDQAMGWEIYSMNIDGSAQTRLTNNSNNEWFEDYD